MRRLFILVGVLAGGLLGCDQGPDSPGLDTDPDTGLPPNHPEIDELRSLATSRGSGRLSVNQLRLSFPLVAGETADGDPITWSRLETYSRGLGEPDYADVTIENLDPSPLYAKFMDDAAREICNKLVTGDPNQARAEDRTLYRFVDFTDTVESNPTGVDANLRYLKLRFHGIRIPDGDAEGLSTLRNLFTRAVEAAQGNASQPSQNHVREGWRLVCVALMTSAEFHVY